MSCHIFTLPCIEVTDSAVLVAAILFSNTTELTINNGHLSWRYFDGNLFNHSTGIDVSRALLDMYCYVNELVEPAKHSSQM